MSIIIMYLHIVYENTRQMINAIFLIQYCHCDDNIHIKFKLTFAHFNISYFMVKVR